VLRMLGITFQIVTIGSGEHFIVRDSRRTKFGPKTITRLFIMGAA
jgi:hypothetical protein